MATTYIVTVKSTGKTHKMNDDQLKKFIEQNFTKVTPRTHSWVYNKILHSKVPFENGVFRVTHKGIDENPMRPSWPMADAPQNKQLDIADRHIVNYWTVLNTETNKSTYFNNLAAAARAFNVSYAYLYTRIRFTGSYTFGHLTFMLNQVPERLDSAARLKEIM